MDLNQAIQNIEAVIRQYRGTLEEHTILQQALKTVKEALVKASQSNNIENLIK